MLKKTMPVLALTAAGLLSAVSVTAQAETIVVVAGQNFAVDHISLNQLEDIWLKRTNYLDDTRVTVADQQEGSKIRDDFYDKVTHKSPTQIKAYWTKLVFTGRGSAPKTLRDDSEVKHWVSVTSGGIGYIDKASVDKSVKVLISLP